MISKLKSSQYFRSKVLTKQIKTVSFISFYSETVNMKTNLSPSLSPDRQLLLSKTAGTSAQNLKNYGSISTPPDFTLNISAQTTGLPMIYPTGERVVFIDSPKKRGMILEQIKVERYCSKHVHKPYFYLLQMDWNSTLWLSILHCIYFSYKWLIFYPIKYFIFIPCKWLLKNTGVTSFFACLLRPLLLQDFGIKKWCNSVMGGCLSILGRNRSACPQELEDEKSFEQRMKTRGGIQGFNNSCHLDAFLFSIFYSCTAFDPILENNDDSYSPAGKIKAILKNDIVLPLRQVGLVTANQVWKLRKCLEPLDPKITGSFMAIEDIVYLLFEKGLNLPKFIHYTVGHPHQTVTHSDFMHIMCVNGNDASRVVTTQQVFKQSMELLGSMRFQRVPSPALILSLPWQGNKFFHYDAIIPSFELEIFSFMSNPESMCMRCGEEVAIWEARNAQVMSLLCNRCVAVETNTHKEYVSRTTMMLTAVICYRGEHFTTYVRKAENTINGQEPWEGDKWLRFDSMSGNYATIIPAERLEESINSIVEQLPENGKLPDEISQHAKAFCLDGHTCIYEPKFYESCNL